MISVSSLIEKFKYALDNKWGYIPGKSGSLWTQKLQDAATDEMVKKYGAQWIGNKVADCSGLFSWAFNQLGGKMYHGSNTMYRKWCTETGKITSYNVKPGYAVFKVKDDPSRSDGKDYYHVGLYIGNNTVIEAKGTRYGVTTSKLSAWSHYGALKGVYYGDEQVDEPAENKPEFVGTAIVDVPNDGTVNVRNKPTTRGTILQTLPEGAIVEVLSNADGWSAVKIETTGYIMSKFLKEAQ